MKLKEMFKNEEVYLIERQFSNNGFNNFWNEYAPTSRFYTKDIEDNKTLYVRRDFNKYRGHNVFKYRSWIRDHNKDVSDKDFDVCEKAYNSIHALNDLLNFINQ